MMRNDLIQQVIAREPALARAARAEEVFWRNSGYNAAPVPDTLTTADIDDAEARLERFAPFIRRRYPETEPWQGRIESPLREIPDMLRAMDCGIAGRLFLKMDSHLAIAGSVKARGGIYEVLKHAEDLALASGLLGNGDSYEVFDSDGMQSFLSGYTVQVGSTGNLGLSIGIMSAALGFRVIVHMSQDAREWKKALLRENGVTVVEYADDYSAAVEQGRRLSDADPKSYFVDDENSQSLFLGYSVAARRLAPQLREAGVRVDAGHPLFVYIPCGVGGAPGGITFGLKRQFGENVHCFFVEPVQAPCMLLGMASGLHNRVSVKDFGLTGQTHADGLAVGRPSGFVGGMMAPLLSGEFTVSDAKLYDYMRMLMEAEDVFIEPSACAAFAAPQRLMEEAAGYLDAQGLTDKMKRAAHIVWATGGSLVPEDVRAEYMRTRPAN